MDSYFKIIGLISESFPVVLTRAMNAIPANHEYVDGFTTFADGIITVHIFTVVH